MYCSLIVEGAVGLTPRRDDTIELQPLAHDWSYFLLDGLRYRGHDLTIVWDQPDGQVRYPGYPEGFSLCIDDALAFTRPGLDHTLYDPVSQLTSEPVGQLVGEPAGETRIDGLSRMRYRLEHFTLAVVTEEESRTC